MIVEDWPIEKVIPYENNPRKNDEAVEKVANSIREFSFQQPIVVDQGGVIIAGHTRYKAAKMLGLSEVPVTVAEGLSDNQIQAYRLADNKTSEFADWDFDKLNEELESIDWFDCDMTQFGFYLEKQSEDDTYSKEVNGLIYEPSGNVPSLFDLADIEKAERLKKSIDESNLPDIEKDFLKVAAMRHVVFDYGKIADYYAQASPEMQRLMEDSVLVIVDFDKAIEDGYVKLRNSFDAEFEKL